MSDPEEAAPPPMTPPDCDLRGLPFMPLDTIRLLDSDLFALSTGDEFKAALALWCKSWQQLPAGSLPVDTRVLAHLSGAGLATWNDVSEIALRGWVLCSDGRLYHPVVAEKAIDAWAKRGKWRERHDTKTERQQRWREKLRILSNRLREAGIGVPEHPTARQLEELCRQNNVDSDVDGETPTVDAKTTGKTGDRGQGKGTKSISLGAAKRGTRLPGDFEVPADWIEWATMKGGATVVEANRQAPLFVDHWSAKSGQAGVKTNWLATWRNWIRRAPQFERGGGSRNRTPDGKEYLGV